jgi:hypothetical protein
MSAERLPGNQAADAGDGTAGDTAIVVVSRDPGARQNLYRELAKRYGANYQIVVCAEPEGLAPLLRMLLAGGTLVALVIGGIGGLDPGGSTRSRPPGWDGEVE